MLALSGSQRTTQGAAPIYWDRNIRWESEMTLHTRVMVTSPGVDPRAAFIKMRQIVGAGEQYSASETETSFEMALGQGLPALMWVKHNNGERVSEGGHDEWCDGDCSGEWDDIPGYLEINYDTAYGYRADNNASCGDLHAWITQEVGAWLTSQGATWEWYDESGDGWKHGPGWGTLGDPEIGALDSKVIRNAEDGKRAFGNAVTALLGGGL